MVPPEEPEVEGAETEPKSAKKPGKSAGSSAPKDDSKDTKKAADTAADPAEPVADKDQGPKHAAKPGKAKSPEPEKVAGGDVKKGAEPAVEGAPSESKGEDSPPLPVEEGVPAEPAAVDVKARGPRERGDRRGRRPERKETWEPKTRLGLLVRDGKITTMSEALRTRYPLREPEIIDILLPELDDEVLDVNMVQRMTDSGRRVRFAIITVVGNGDGYVGLGKATGKEVGPAIRKAIDNAKLNIIEIKRGCGSWECGCGEPHSIPFVVKGKSGSAEVTFKPAPRGISLAVGDVAKHILKLAGVNDAWGFTAGKTRTTVNYAKAAFDALRKISEMRIMPEQEDRLHIHTGSIGKIEEGGTEE
jgi:small subunit ribosomal protein S5